MQLVCPPKKWMFLKRYISYSSSTLSNVVSPSIASLQALSLKQLVLKRGQISSCYPTLFPGNLFVPNMWTYSSFKNDNHLQLRVACPPKTRTIVFQRNPTSIPCTYIAHPYESVDIVFKTIHVLRTPQKEEAVFENVNQSRFEVVQLKFVWLHYKAGERVYGSG